MQLLSHAHGALNVWPVLMSVGVSRRAVAGARKNRARCASLCSGPKESREFVPGPFHCRDKYVSYVILWR